jgi:hypothetical protein
LVGFADGLKSLVGGVIAGIFVWERMSDGIEGMAKWPENRKTYRDVL